MRYLPSNSLIQDFSDEICRSLEESNKRVAELKAQMREAEGNAHVVREELHRLQGRYGRHAYLTNLLFHLIAQARCSPTM